MIFANVKSITIPEGAVKRILRGAEVLWKKVTGSIPSEYQEVEWISGFARATTHRQGAYLDLGFTFDTAATVYVAFKNIARPAGYLFGAAENSGKYRCMLTINENIMAYCFTGSGFGAIAADYPSYGTDIRIEYFVRAGEAGVKNLDTGKTQSILSSVAFTMTSNLYLFAQNYNGTARCGGGGVNDTQVKAFRYYDKNGVLVCDLIPCYRKSDGVVGAYDTVRKIFLSSAGEYALNKGPDVSDRRYTNQIPIATDTDGTVFNGTGYKTGCRLSSSSGSVITTGTGVADYEVTGFVPIVKGNTIRLKDVQFGNFGASPTFNGIGLYKADKSFISYMAYTDLIAYCSGVTDDNGVITQFTCSHENFANAKFIRFSAYEINDSSIITVNEPIT